jgi:hypothetical protein
MIAASAAHSVDGTELLAVRHRFREHTFEDNAAESKVIQEVMAGLALAGSPATSAALLQQLSASAVKTDLRIDDMTKHALWTLKQTLVETSEKIIKENHEIDLQLLENHADKLLRCRDDERNSAQSDNITSQALNDSEASHQACRAKLDELHILRNQTCAKLDYHMANLETPDCTVPNEVAAMDTYYKGLLHFVQSNLPVWQRLERDCKNATAAIHKKHEQCDGAQGSFESSFCAWRYQAVATCGMYASCYERGLELFNSTKDTVLQNAESRKIDWKAIQKIKCFVDVLISAGSNEERSGMFVSCEQLDTDTSDLDITVPPVSAMRTCEVTSVVEDYPCTEGFLSRYANMSTIAQCRPCAPLPERFAPNALTSSKISEYASSAYQ